MKQLIESGRGADCRWNPMSRRELRFRSSVIAGRQRDRGPSLALRKHNGNPKNETGPQYRVVDEVSTIHANKVLRDARA